MPRYTEPRLCDIDLVKFNETDLAYKVGLPGTTNSDTWLPKSQTDVDYSGQRKDANGRDILTFTIPQWLARAKDLEDHAI